MEMEVGQREREEEGFWREGESTRTDLEVQVLARPAIDLLGGERLQRRFRLGDHGPEVGERNRSDQGGRGEDAVLHGLEPPHRMVRYAFDLEVERRHVVEEARVYEVVGVSACLCAISGRPVEEASDSAHSLQEGGHAEVVE